MSAATREDVGLRLEARIATITLTSPPVNALTRPLVEGLERALDGAQDANVVILRSAVDGVFAAGADLDLMRRADPDEFLAYLDELRAVVERVAAFPVPVVAVLDGHALGGGLELALACTLRVASTRARLGVPEIRLGLIPGAGGTQRLPRLVGAGLAADLVLTGRTLDGETACARGLVERVCVPESLDDVVEELAGAVARFPRSALAGGLVAVRAASSLAGVEGAAVEREVIAGLFAGADAREGITAFHERRAPDFPSARPGASVTPGSAPDRSTDTPGGLSTGGC